MKTLDMSRPYGTVHGGSGEAAFEQDGCLFRRDFTLVDPKSPPGGRERLSHPRLPPAIANDNAESSQPPSAQQEGTTSGEPVQMELPEAEFSAKVKRMAASGKKPKEIWTELGVHHTKVLAVLNRA